MPLREHAGAVLLGALPLSAPMTLHPAWNAASTPGVGFCGVCAAVALWALAVALWVPSVTEPRTARWTKLAFGVWLFVASPLALLVVAATTAGAGIVGSLAVIAVGLVSVVLASAVLLAAKGPRWRARGLTPQKIVEHKGSEGPASPELLAWRIVERSEQIGRTLRGEPSEVEVEMCVVGYGVCMEDLILLERVVDEELPKSGPIRRLRLGAIRRTATYSLCRTGGAFPAALRTSRRERS